MMVTSVTPVDKRKSKVFLEEGFAFVLYRGEIERFGIEEGNELPDDTYRFVLEQVLIPRAKDRALYLLGSSGKTESWVRRKLMDGGYPEEAVDRVMSFLKEYKLVDDEAYAESYVRSLGAKKSRRQMAYELCKKGIEKELIEQAFAGAPVDDEESARQQLNRRMKGKTTVTREERRRLCAWLGQKGYSYDVINSIMREIKTQEEADCQD